MDSSTTKASSQDIIDLEEGQFASEEPDAKEEAEEQTEPADANGVEPLASEHQPQATPSAKDPPVEIIDLEEGQVASDETADAEAAAQGGLKLQAAEAMVVNGLSSEHQPVEGGPSATDGTKASDEIVDLEEGQVACAAQGDLILQAAEAPDVDGVEALASSEHRPQEDGPSAVDGRKVSDEIIDLEEGQVEDMDLSDDDDVVVVKRQPSDDAAVQSQASAPAALHGVSAPIHASSSAFIDETPPRGVKRARMESAEPSVRVVYNNLTRESKRRLMELMQQWSEWQARKQHSLTESVDEILECGEETYYPALHVGSERHSVSFCVDYQARDHVAGDEGAVPLYNREFTLGSTPLGDSSNAESKQDKEDSRCFNCGSYSHALKDCPKPRDHVAISNARKQHNSKRNLSNANRGQNRYYQKTPGKFDDLKAGVLGSETRECLGLREHDPPPWLHRMRELGYPPGYLDEVEDEDKPSGITIFVDGETKAEHEEGELPEKGSPSPPPRKKMTVEFPGINAPVPENGDPWLWGSAPPPQSSLVRHHHHPSSDSRDRGGPPGAEHYSSSRHGVLGATPGLVRSHSDRSGRRSSSSSSGYNENPPPPPPGEEATWTPHGYSSRQHSSSSERHSRDRERERERDWHDRHYYSSSSRR